MLPVTFWITLQAKSGDAFYTQRADRVLQNRLNEA
jgi:hypothetical protein